MNIPRVYCAGPYSSHDDYTRRMNTVTAVKLGKAVIRTGCEPVIPHILGQEMEDVESRWEWWMYVTSRQLSDCAAMVTVPWYAESVGTLAEIEQCAREKRPVFRSFWSAGTIVIDEGFFKWLEGVRG